MPANQSPVQQLFACHLPYRRRIDADVAKELLDRLNGADDGCRDCHRVLLWSEGRPIPIEAALMRHELRHAEQYEAAPATYELARLATDVVATAKGGSGVLYNQIPNEKDANATAFQYATLRFGQSAVEELADDFDGPPVFRQQTPIDPRDLPQSIVQFLRAHRDLCLTLASQISGTTDPTATFRRLLAQAAGDQDLADLWDRT